MSEKLEKCPFCGGEASIARSIDRVEHDEWVASINCDSCDVSLTPWYTSTSQGEAVSAAISAWNRRELESASQPGGGEAVNNQMLAALRDVLKRIEGSDQWWMDNPDRGGFDVDMIEKAIASAAPSAGNSVGAVNNKDNT